MKKSQIIFFSFFILIYLFLGVGFCSAWDLNGGTYPNIPLAPQITSASKLPAYILYLFFAGIYVAGMLAVISLVIAGIQFMMSAENPSRISAATDRIKGSVIGLIVLLGAVILLGTINPYLKQLGISLDIAAPAGLHFNGSGGDAGAPDSVDNMSSYGGKYNQLCWPKTIATINGSKDNCDKNAYAYMVYLYPQASKSGAWSWAELKCGDCVGLNGAGSYLAIKEGFGVYFYGREDCTPSTGDFTPNYPQSASTAPIPAMATYWTNANIRCVRIINGPDKNGPFYGVILFKNNNYQGNALQEDFGLNSGVNTSGPIKSIGGIATGTSISLKNWYSAAIYQKAGYDSNGNPTNAGDGITLINSGRNKDEAGDGKYCPDSHSTSCIISGADISNNIWQKQLSDMKITYSGDTSQKLMDSCPYFDSSAVDPYDRKDCFQTMNIGGNFLVLLSDYQIQNNDPSFSSRFGYVQAFPEVRAPEGPADLGTTYISHNAKYIKIFPLAAPFVPPS